MRCPVALVKSGKGVSDVSGEGRNGPVPRPQLGHALHWFAKYSENKLKG